MQGRGPEAHASLAPQKICHKLKTERKTFTDQNSDLTSPIHALLTMSELLIPTTLPLSIW